MTRGAGPHAGIPEIGGDAGTFRRDGGKLARWGGAGPALHCIGDAFFIGGAVTALAADPRILGKSGGAYSSWGLAREYGFTDIDGETPDWGRYLEENVAS